MTDLQLEQKIELLKIRLATSLEEYRIKHGLTQVEMGSKCNIIQGKYSRIKNGKFHGITVEFLIKLNLKVDTGFHLIDMKDY